MNSLLTSVRSVTGGTFEFIEAKIRRDAEGTTFGGDFEWLCQWFLENAPRYRGQFDKVWLWKDWPERWGPDAGIDLVARTRAGELWAIQAKADHPDRAIPKREIDSFLSESNRSQFAYRLFMATTDDIGATARRTLHGQEKPVGLVLRGHFLTEEVQWPVQIGGTAARLPRWTARPHQATAIDAVVNGFQDQDHDRGRLIMACGTGKTLTALWIAERLQSSLTLVLVPSLSLVQQNLAEWGRHLAKDFDTLVVCSDESVVQSQADTAIQSTADLGVQVTTDAEKIRHFLGQRRQRPAVVFATYQSSDRIATAQAGKAKPFELAICDESHRLAGHAEGLFATVLDGKKIKASKRLFMTATPRYFQEHVKRRAAELEFELVSMDDAQVFGPEFHVLTFHEAISAKPEPLLTDYQVVVIGVTDREAKAWAERATLVRTAEGLSTDARTLAAQIGLAKAMRKYDLRKLITFHSSVAKAARFVDATRRDSLPGVIPHLTRSARPSGKLWTKHISGHTPAGQRATLLKGLGHLPEDTRGILSNCACLGEGVDVPVLDGVAFIDPKRSMVDIIQAVGRVIRKAEGKQLGTIVIPVFIDESEDADHVLSQSAFEPVWQVLKALRAHDRRLADELDQLRLSLGKRSKSDGRINLPDNIHLDVPRLLLHDFEQAFYVRTVKQTTDKSPLTIEQILAWADEHKAATGDWPISNSGQVTGTDETWTGINLALRRGGRGLPGRSSLPKLLQAERGVRNRLNQPDLSVKQIAVWADAHKAATGRWPLRSSGQLRGTSETWAGIDLMLKRGGRGLPRGGSLAKLLQLERGVRNLGSLSDLTVQQILAWVDGQKAVTGEWPNVRSEFVADADETWAGIDSALKSGRRGLPGGASLAELLHTEREAPYHLGRPNLTIKQILTWVDAHKAATGAWPKQNSGSVLGTDETWSAINDAMNRGSRGLPGGSSIAKLLDDKRSVRNIQALPDLTIKQILAWADAHKTATGVWPKGNSGSVKGMDERWSAINQSLMKGSRGLRGGVSLAKLLKVKRGVSYIHGQPDLSIEQILAWADAHHAATGEWPKKTSGSVKGADETWEKISYTMDRGGRGLPRGLSLAQLLYSERDVRNRLALPELTVTQIVAWADAHEAATGAWPTLKSGSVNGTEESWAEIDAALRGARRGLQIRASLAQLLASERGVRNKQALLELTTQQILEWADGYKVATGEWPKRKSGPVKGTDETWSSIDAALRVGGRGLPTESSLAELLHAERGVRNQRSLPDLSVKQIAAWADAHKAATGRWPQKNSGFVQGTVETWSAINAALRFGSRGLPAGSSLAEMFFTNRDLSVEQILAWADAHKAQTGQFPNFLSGPVAGEVETWAGINHALRRGSRGLTGGTSLAKLLANHRSVRK